MARSFSSAIAQAARAADRAHRANVRAQVSHARALDRQAQASRRAAKQAYLESRADEADDLNHQLELANSELDELLKTSLSKPLSLDFTALKRKVDLQDLDSRLRNPREPALSTYVPPEPGFLKKLLPGTKEKFAKAKLAGEGAYQRTLIAYEALLAERSEAIVALTNVVENHNSRIDDFEESVRAGEVEETKLYFELMLANSEYPDDFPQNLRIGYVAESRQLVVEVQLPTIEQAIPGVERYTFVKSADEIREKPRTEKSRRAQYADAIAQVMLRVCHEIFSADIGGAVDVAAVNGFVVATDPGTGREVQPYLLSLRVSRDAFSALSLAAVDPSACLRLLKANVSRSPAELSAVKPVVDINMADPRFIDEQDVLATLDTRPNLMELTPSEFESLITNLFQSMGLETRLTQASRDGGVDCVAFDPRPVLGGKVIVQAKRYKNTVGVSAVRDLFGTVHNEGASKGVLVTTSGYGKAAFTFAEGKPLELLSGSNLLYLLKEHAGVDAKIEAPDDWVDPVLDVSS